MKCPKCHHIMINVDAVSVCPECYHVEIDDDKWKGLKTNCPKCGHGVKVFVTSDKRKVFHCTKCDSIGHIFTHHDMSKKVYKIPKHSKEGRKLSWLFEVPCQYWRRKDEVYDKICKAQCPLRAVCDEHSKVLDMFCKNKEIEIFLCGDFIEIVHK